MKLSPMMRHYMGIKEKYPDCVIFYRLGDFYELFFEDALEISKVLGLTLTGRNCGLKEKAPMCGVPFHSVSTYIKPLVEQGYKVAICEQTEDPALAKGIVKREVVRIITPGTNTIDDDINIPKNNYLSTFCYIRGEFQLAFVDIGTGEFAATYKEASYKSLEDMLNEIVKLGISEIIVNESMEEFISKEKLIELSKAFVTVKPDNYFVLSAALELIKSHFNVESLSAIGILGEVGPIEAIGAALEYLNETQMNRMQHITGVRIYNLGSNMSIDKATMRNLELTETLYDKENKGSLLHVLDKTKTAHGARMLKQWLIEPLNHLKPIEDRLNAVEEIKSNLVKLNELRNMLNKIYDFQRITGKIATSTINPKDMIALKKSLSVLPEIRAILEDSKSDLLLEIFNNIFDFSDIENRIETAISEDAPFTIRDGGIFKQGYSDKLDELHLSIKDGKDWMASLESKERERTGIKNLKVGFNNVFGYYLDVNKSQIDKVPDFYIRKQTLVNNERYITPKMKEVESVILNGEEKINKLEAELFEELRQWLIPEIPKMQETATKIAMLDVLSSLAYVAVQNNYIRPEINESTEIDIVEGRHPVVETMERGDLFVPNDVKLDRNKDFMAIITGPNMSGKSTYMRQTALIVLMAQMGSFVPCESAKIGIVDRIFTRIGASDNLTQGKSTFFVEMSELAYILSSATSRSLVILDEIGRGTSTYDGMSIAFATVSYLCKPNRMIRTMFATHYHELTVLEDQIKGVFNLNVDVHDESGEIVFLHKIVRGAASQSYGIHVAKLAGVPKEVLLDAEYRLNQLEEDHDNIVISNNHNINNKDNSESNNSTDTENDHAVQPEEVAAQEISEYKLESKILNKISNIDINELRPSEAIRILEDLKEIIHEN